ncbi:MAG: hypothetical protein JXA99_12595 [Candidatus Lokiarchaeota archaeon]|nr:hypothetical protein [Candidatus Lokiarchaeota archaeon]
MLKMDYEFSLSNIGRITSLNNTSNFKIKSINGPIFSAHDKEKIVGVNTFEGIMNITLIFRDITLNLTSGERIKQLAMNELNRAINQ